MHSTGQLLRFSPALSALKDHRCILCSFLDQHSDCLHVDNLCNMHQNLFNRAAQLLGLPTDNSVLTRRIVMLILAGLISVCFAVSLSLSYYSIYDGTSNKSCPVFNLESNPLVVGDASAGRKSVIFMKTHKTGSSTVSGILWRYYCESMQLNCFLPPFNNPGRTWDFAKRSDREYAQHSVGTQNKTAPFDVWVNHAVRHNFISSGIVNGSEHAGTQIVSIVRHPVARFRSAWTWYKLGKSFFPHYKLFGTYSIAHPQFTLERFAALVEPSACKSSTATTSTDSHNTIQAHTTRHRYQSWLYTLFTEQAELLLSWYVQYRTRHFKYRTGLDATSEELTGIRSTDPQFATKFQQLLDEVVRGELFLLVCDRYEESLLILRKRVLKPSYSEHTADTTLHSGSGGKVQAVPHATLTSSNHSKNHNHTHSVSSHLTFTMPELLHLKQKQQTHSTETLSAAAADTLTRLQPHDSALHRAADIMLNKYIAYYYQDNMQLFHEELRELRGALASLESACSTSTRSTNNSNSSPAITVDKQQQMLCAQLQRDNRDLVQEAWRRLGKAPL